MQKSLTLLAIVFSTAICAGCASRGVDIERKVADAVSELDRAIWADGLKPIVPAADKPKTVPLK